MAKVADILDRLVSGELTVDEVVADFSTRSWPAYRSLTAVEAMGFAEPPPNDPESWHTVSTDSRLTPEVRARLAAGYQAALHFAEVSVVLS